MPALLHPIDAATWPAVSALLDEGLSLPVAERDAWLQSLDGERAAHRDTVRALLAMAASLDTADFLATLPRFTQAVSPVAPSYLTELSAGESIGPYRLIAEVGTGGMGAVWLAERADGVLKRKVALKLPRMMWAKGLAERMARERDILANLEHPNIARLYDAGVDQHGRPYLAIEYVEGQPIDGYARERGLDVKDKLQLLLQVCDAVAFAHSRLVVHRDLKPSNILVTRDGQVRLLDFGIAKLIEGDSATETQLTQASGRALTLDYASPEQIHGHAIGTSSDVYSLGVVAYELLTGAKPYKLKRGSAAELEEAIASADVPKASEAATEHAAKKALRGDLDAILNKALKKQPAERYATVHAFAEDVTRHVAGEGVAARPDTLLYRASRWFRRHGRSSAVALVTLTAFAIAIGIGAAALAMFALSIGLAAALWQAVRAQRKANEASANAARAEAVQQYLIGIFRTNSAKQSNPAKARQTTARELLDIGKDVFQNALQSEPAAKAQVGVLLSDLYSELGLAPEAADLARQAVQLMAKVHGEQSREYIRALSHLIIVLSNVSGATEERRQAGDRALTLLSKHHHGPSRERAFALRAVGLSRYGDEAVAHLKDAVAAAEAVGDHREARASLEQLGLRLNMVWQSHEANRCYERALVHHQAIRDANDYETLFMRVGLAEGYLSVLRINDACTAIDQAYAIACRTGSADGLDVVQTRWRRARMLATIGRLDEAIAEFDAVLSVVEEPSRMDKFTAANAAGERALAVGWRGQRDDAFETHERAVKYADEARPDSPLACTARERFATTLLAYRDIDRAAEVGEEVRMRRLKLGSAPGRPDFDRALMIAARCAIHRGRLEDAERTVSELHCLQNISQPVLLTLEARGIEFDLAARTHKQKQGEAVRKWLEDFSHAQKSRGFATIAQSLLILAEARYLSAQGLTKESQDCAASIGPLLPAGLLPSSPILQELASLAERPA